MTAFVASPTSAKACGIGPHDERMDTWLITMVIVGSPPGTWGSGSPSKQPNYLWLEENGTILQVPQTARPQWKGFFLLQSYWGSNAVK